MEQNRFCEMTNDNKNDSIRVSYYNLHTQTIRPRFVMDDKNYFRVVLQKKKQKL